MFKIYKCDIRGKKEHIVKDNVTTHVNVRDGNNNHKHYKLEKKIKGKIAGDYKLYYYDLIDIESGKLFSMKTENNIEVDDKPIYIGVEDDDIIAFSKNELNAKETNKNNYTLIESKTANLTGLEIFYGLLMFVMYMIPIISLTINWAFIKDIGNIIKVDYKNYPAIVVKIIIGLVMIYQIKMLIVSMSVQSSLSNWYTFVQTSTIYTGLLSFMIVMGSICYFKMKRIKNLQQFNKL